MYCTVAIRQCVTSMGIIESKKVQTVVKTCSKKALDSNISERHTESRIFKATEVPFSRGGNQDTLYHFVNGSYIVDTATKIDRALLS